MKVSQTFGLCSLIFAAVACGGPDSAGELAPPAAEESTTADALRAVFCRGDGANQCLAGESCLAVNDTQSVCSAGRCIDQGDCRDNYVCRTNHCIRVEEDPARVCPRGSVEGRAECPAGSHAVVVSREPLCTACERDPPIRPDRCGPNYHPVARGDCRAVLGYYWDGRVCVGLTGCEITNADGLYRTGEACERAFAECSGR